MTSMGFVTVYKTKQNNHYAIKVDLGLNFMYSKGLKFWTQSDSNAPSQICAIL